MRPRSETITTTCFFHTGGFMSALWAMVYGCCLNHMVGRDFNIDVLVDTIIEKRPAMVGLDFLLYKFLFLFLYRNTKCAAARIQKVSMGPHHYVNLSEHKRLETLDPSLLDSVKVEAFRILSNYYQGMYLS